MSLNEKLPGGDTPDVSDNGSPSQDTVKYDTYKRLLGEKKKRDEELSEIQKRLSEFEAKEKERTEAELKKNNQFQEIIKLREQELNAEKAKRESLEQGLQRAMKLSAFQEALPGQIAPKFFDWVDVSDIAIDPTTGKPDATSVQNFAKDWAAKYPEVIQKKTGVGLPGHATETNNSKLTYEAWLALPPKERKARMGEIVSILK